MWHQSPNTRLVEPGDTSFWKTRWKTDAFRALIEDPRTGYARALEQASLRPWWFVDATQPYERRHFSVWFANTIVNRTYENALIEDLYYWHDLLHGLTFARSAGASEDQWRLNMRANEILVSLETEVQIYWRNPDLRNGSFDHPIWHDTLDHLAPSARQRLIAYRKELPQNTSPVFEHERALLAATMPSPCPVPEISEKDVPSGFALWALRRAVSINPDPSSHEEVELARYEATADPFYDQWRGSWREVEHERAVFEDLCAQGHWRQAVARRHACWEKVADANGVPYGELAQALA